MPDELRGREAGQIQKSPAWNEAMRGTISWSRDEESLRIVVPQRDNIGVNHAAGDGVYQPVLVGDATAPKPVLLTCQRFRLADACEWMLPACSAGSMAR